jgi:glycosyltransferase involved in cell wall biosynthesis
MTPFFSIIIPSFLGAYPNAAKRRDTKIYRALNSVLQQTFTSFEALIVADGCIATADLITAHYRHDPRLRCVTMPKQPIWSGGPRNRGINEANGTYILYLDIDDFLGTNHLQRLHDAIQAAGRPQWVFFNDWLGRPDYTFVERHCFPDRKHRNGTSNVCHSRTINVQWPSGYLHDYTFIQQLVRQSPPVIVPAGEYYVCHVPKTLDI